MADVVDTMFGWLLEIFEWLIKAFLKVCGWILKLFWIGIKSILGLIVGLFRKDDRDNTEYPTISTRSPSELSTEVPSESALAMRSYDDLLSDIATIDNSSDAEQSAQDLLMNIELTGLLHNSLTYAQKARLLKKGEEKLTEITNDPIERGTFFGNLVSTAYDLINNMTNNAVQDHADKYKAGLDPNNQEVELEPLGNYIIDIMNIVAAMYSPDGKASFRVEMLEGIDLPMWAGDIA